MSQFTNRIWILCAGAFLLAGALFILDRGSLERGNRLYRGGASAEAVAVYRGVTQGEGEHGAASYNLGTALLPSDPALAEVSLRGALEGGDSLMTYRSHYNLGYRYLSAVNGAMEPDSAVIMLDEAIANLRIALRGNPTDANARWNLALAQRKLDALAPITEDPSRESGGTNDEEMVIDDAYLSRSETAEARSGLEPEDPRAADNTGERQGAQEGAREAWAMQDPGPLTEEAAGALLGRVRDDPETMIRGILWANRPEVAWWRNAAFPGGNW
jgi:hypothetical protein